MLPLLLVPSTTTTRRAASSAKQWETLWRVKQPLMLLVSSAVDKERIRRHLLQSAATLTTCYWRFIEPVLTSQSAVPQLLEFELNVISSCSNGDAW